MKSLYYICVQPATTYYAWQVEVMLNNFKKNNIDLGHVHLLMTIHNGQVSPEWEKLQNKYTEVGFYFYWDQRIRPIYISSVRPHVLKQHFSKNQYLSDAAIFYHDCDMVFTKPVNWDKFLDDDTWYLSDTISYIGAKYIKSKQYGVYERMCEIVGLHTDIPEQNEEHSGGAQYIIKNVDARFWDKVEQDSEMLYGFFLNHLSAFPEGCLNNYHPIQKWTADMWAVLWNAWYFNHNTKIVPEMNFTWAIGKSTDWESNYIFHNAGVIGENDRERLFFKGSYIYKLPYNIDLNDYDSQRCSYRYVEEILETARTSCLT